MWHFRLATAIRGDMVQSGLSQLEDIVLLTITRVFQGSLAWATSRYGDLSGRGIVRKLRWRTYIGYVWLCTRIAFNVMQYWIVHVVSPDVLPAASADALAIIQIIAASISDGIYLSIASHYALRCEMIIRLYDVVRLRLPPTGDMSLETAMKVCRHRVRRLRWAVRAHRPVRRSRGR